MLSPDLMSVGDKSEMFIAVVELMESSESNRDLAVMALRFVSQVFSQDNDSLVDQAIERGVLFSYLSILKDDRAKVVQEALWGISNIVAGPDRHLEAFFLH